MVDFSAAGQNIRRNSWRLTHLIVFVGRYFSASGCLSGTHYGGLVQAYNTINAVATGATCAVSNAGVPVDGTITTALNQFTTVTPIAPTTTTPSTTVVTAGSVFLASFSAAPLVRLASHVVTPRYGPKVALTSHFLFLLFLPPELRGGERYPASDQPSGAVDMLSADDDGLYLGASCVLNPRSRNPPSR